MLLNLVGDLGTEGVRVRFAGDVDREVVSDAELVKLALRPLVENGLTYGQPRHGHGHRRRRARGHQLGGSRRRLPPHQRADRPAVPARPPLGRAGGAAGLGAGLGLTLAKAYAQVLSGEVSGRAGEHGTVFWVKVPAPAAEGAW